MDFLTPLKAYLDLFIAALVVVAFVAIGWFAFDQGGKRVQAAWDRDRLAQAEASSAALQSALADNAELRVKHAADLAAVRKEGKDENDKITAAYTATQRLRIGSSKGSCVPRVAQAGETTSASGSNEAPTGTFTLSESTDRDIKGLMREADEIVASCRMLQNLVIREGLYIQP